MSTAEASADPPASATTSGARPDTRTVASVERQLAPPVSAARAEACPLCGSPLNPEQDWCLQCGAAARTRLAATPNWKAPIATLAVVAALALGVLAAALVKLAGGSGDASSLAATTVTTAPAASTPAASTPTATTPGATVPGATVTGATPATPATPGATTPGAATTTPGGASTGLAAGGATAPPASTLTPAEREALRQANSPLSGK